MSSYIVSGEIIKKIGYAGNIILSNLNFWIDKNRVNKKHFHKGKYWTYNSVKAFNTMYDFMTEWEIRKALNQLKDDEYIELGNFNKSTYDRTNWYSITQKGIDLLNSKEIKNSTNASEDNKIPFEDFTNGIDEILEPIPDILTNNKTNNKEVNTISENKFSASDLNFENSSSNKKTTSTEKETIEINFPVKVKKTKSIKTAHPAYAGIVEFWLKEFHPGWAFTALHGTKINSIIKKLEKTIIDHKTEATTENVVQSFKLMCLKLPEWFKDKDLATIDSKYNEIVSQIKKPKNEQPTKLSFREAESQRARDFFEGYR